MMPDRFKFELRKTLRGLSDEELLEDLRRSAKQLGRSTITQNEYEKVGRGHPYTMHRRFGSWTKALERADLEPSRSKIGITDDELMENLKFVWTRLGRQPSYKELRRPLSSISTGTYEKRFGSWTKALISFVDWVNAEDQNGPNSMDAVNPQESGSDKKSVRRTRREVSERQRFRILLRDGFACSTCGASPVTQRGVELHVDHAVPWSKGGETVDENLQSKCSRCNLGKGNAFEA